MSKFSSTKARRSIIILIGVSALLFALCIPQALALEQTPNYIFPNEVWAHGEIAGGTKNVIIYTSGINGDLVVRNYSDVWLTLSASPSGGAVVSSDDIFVNFGVLPPEGTVTYHGVFTQVGQTIAISAEYDYNAWLWNTADTIIGLIPGGDALGPSALGQTLVALKDLNYIQKAAIELQAIKNDGWISVPSHALAAANELRKLATDDQQAEAVVAIMANVGIYISKDIVKDCLILLSIYDELKHIAHTLVFFIVAPDGASVIFEAEYYGTPPTIVPTPPPPTPTLSPSNDQATFIGDITLPDGTVVSPGQGLTKTWRVRNSGTSTWDGYKLKFVNGERMGGPTEMVLPTTAPGATIDISIDLVSPSTSGLHSGSWQIVNTNGTWVSGGLLWVKIDVQTSNPGSGLITMFDVSPASPSSATSVHLVGRIKFTPDFRSMRFVAGNESMEMTNYRQVGDQYEVSADWNTASLARGTYAILFEVARKGDVNWTNVERQVITYTLTGTPVSTNHPPDRPVLKSPYDWYLKDASGSPASVELCVNPSSDPDGNPVQYYFEAKDQGGGVVANSGWTSNTCWSRTYSASMTYSWRVKAGDGSAESDWSTATWHFSVAGGGVYMGSHSFFALNSDETHMCVFVTYDGIQAPNVSAWINEAADGSENGAWRLLDHYGPNTTPDCTQANYHGFWIRSTRYVTGNHLIKITGVKLDSGASATKMTNYNIDYIKPPSPDLVAPSTNTNNGTWWNTRTIHFDWNPSLRASTYTLRASTNPDLWSDPSPVLNQVLGSTVTEYDYTFTQDYAQLYWGVRASNGSGYSDSGGSVWFGIDLVVPTCQVQALTDTYSEVFQVDWNSVDNSAGIHSSDIQFKDSERGTWEDWLIDAPASKSYDLFTGQTGHTYLFRCRATDRAGNAGAYPGAANASIKVDPFLRPGTPWWDAAYGAKRNLVILNNMPGVALPEGYPVHLHFDASTSPTAATVYSASLSAVKCNDLRVVYNDAIELNRVVKSCSSTAIDIWFRTKTGIPAGTSDGTSHQLYFGNASASNPPNDPSQVWYPFKESDTAYLYFFQEGSGSTTSDASGNNRDCSINPSVQWSSGKFGTGLMFTRANNGNSQSLICGSASLSSFTVDFWIKPNSNGDGRLAGQLASGGRLNWLLSDFEGRMRLDVWPCSSCGSSEIRSNFNLRDAQYVGKWNHVAVSFNGGNEVKFFINGSLDSIKYLNQSGLNQNYIPLEIGSVEGISQINESLGGFRISAGVKSAFPYGAFANITNEPSTAADAVVTPPVAGTPDLTLLSLTTYPNASGGALVQVVVQNQGDLSTQSGFYTDLYLNHQPAGPEDYTNSLRFWVNDPIEPGATVILTTAISDLSSLLSPSAVNRSRTSTAETSGTLYAQTDSAGLVQESDNANNIYTQGVTVCTTGQDAYEDDDAYTAAVDILTENTQTHNFDSLGDADWVRFTALSGKTYRLTTSGLGTAADTYLYLYDTDGVTLLTTNDDFNNTLASQIEWVAPADGTYYARVSHWNPNVGGCGTIYSLTLTGVSITPGRMIFKSVGTQDGLLLESGEFSGVGGMLNSALSTFRLGDEIGDKQYRSILSFSTGGLPDNAVITKATLKIKAQGVQGTNPFTILGLLRAHIRKPYFGTLAGLELGDFQFAPDLAAAGTFGSTPISNWYTAVLKDTAYPFINLTGKTQFRLQFGKDDNDDLGADYMNFFSGNYGTLAGRPTLIIEYYIP